jgi:hypothetical protein
MLTCIPGALRYGHAQSDLALTGAPQIHAPSCFPRDGTAEVREMGEQIIRCVRMQGGSDGGERRRREEERPQVHRFEK